MLFVFQWIMYAYFHVRGLLSGLKGKEAYYQNPFELEAYDNDEKETYLNERKPYAWIDYWRTMQMIDLIIVGFACISIAAFASTKNTNKIKKDVTIENTNETPT